MEIFWFTYWARRKMPSQASNFMPLPPKIIGIPPKITGTETSEIQTENQTKTYAITGIFIVKKPIFLTIVEAYFVLSLTEFFPSVIKKTSLIMALPSLPVGSHKARTVKRLLRDVILSRSQIDSLRFSRPVFCQLSHSVPMHT